MLLQAHECDRPELRDISALREQVQYFSARARDVDSYLFASNISRAGQQAVLREAIRLGIRAEVTGEGIGRSVRVINLARSEALCAVNAGNETVETVAEEED